MKYFKTMLAISMLFSVVGLYALSPETLARVEKERKEEVAKKNMPELLEQLPPDLQRGILKIIAQSEVLNIPALAQGLTTLAATNKALHAEINNPINMLTILKSLPRAGAVVLANGLRNMPGIKSKEVQDWLKSFKLEGGHELLFLVNRAHTVDRDISKIAAILAKPNINVNEKDSNGSTALFEASVYGLTEIVKLLLAAGADVNAKNNDGNTALLFASLNRRIEISKLLLAAGADANVKTKDGETALMYATVMGSTQLINLLLKAGADVTIKNKQGQTALDQAKSRNYIPTEKARHFQNIKILEAAEKAQKEKAVRK